MITADASKVSPQDFARSLGLRIRTQEEKRAEWEAGVERYVDLILGGCQCSEYGNPQVREAKRRIEQMTDCLSDPFLKRSAAR